MDDLIAFLRARLDEDEQAARDCEGDPTWHVAEQAKCDCCARVRSGTSGLVCTPDDRYAAHIARQDPARTLREVEAKATLLGIAVVMLEPHPIPADAAPLGAARVEGQNEANRMSGEVILKVLAAPHDDEPGYLQEWTP